MSGTRKDLILSSARLVGLGKGLKPINNDVLQQLLYALQSFVDRSSNNEFLVYKLTQAVFPVTGQTSYTLGLGGDWNIPRPMKIERIYTRLYGGTPQQVDFPSDSLTALEYASIPVKNITATYGWSFYDDCSWPLRNITFYPIPTGPAEVVLWMRDPLDDLTIQTIYEIGNLNGGTGYTPGYYPDVRLSGGSGQSSAFANITVDALGHVTNCVLTSGGTGYTVGDVLTATLPVGGGTGFSITVTYVSPGLDDPVSYPPGYLEYFRFNLAIAIAGEFGLDIPAYVIETANNTKMELESQNWRQPYSQGDGAMLNNATWNFAPDYVTGWFSGRSGF